MSTMAMPQPTASEAAVRYLITNYSPKGNRVGWLMMASIPVEAWDLYSIAFVLIFIRDQFHPDPLMVGQGSRMSLVGDDLEHVVVVPGGFLAPAAEAGLAAVVSGDEIESDLAQEGEVAGGGAVAHPAVILMEGDVENPVQGVLDAPVPADRPDQDGGIIAAAGEEVAGLGLDFAGTVDAADRLDRQHGAEIGPVAQLLELSDGRAHEDASADQAAVALVEGVEHRPAA